jgi:hypothetical protein
VIKLEVDPGLGAKLEDLAQHVELCDESGRTLGHFLPSAVYDKLFYALLAAESPYSPEDLQRSHQESGGRTLAEIWQRLGRAS